MELTEASRDLGGRTIWLGSVQRWEDLARPAAWPRSAFVLFLAADTASVPEKSRRDVAQALIEAGTAYVCSWGPGSSGLEFDFDMADTTLHPDLHGVVMTTSHEHESLEDALWFAVHAAWPDPDYTDSCAAVVAVAVGNPEWERRIRVYLEAGAPEQDEA